MGDTVIDIETIPQQPEESVKAEIAKNIKPPAQMKKPETIDQWHRGKGKYEGEKEKIIEETYRSTSFDGAKGELASISFAVTDQEIITHTRQGPDEPESKIIIDFFETLKDQSKTGDKPFFIGHYLGGFDLKFLYQRLVVNNIKPAFDIPL